jgi:predicted metalloprotease with PDZ domain
MTLEFVEGPTGSDTLELPAEWAGQTLHSFSVLRVTSEGASLDGGSGSAEQTVHAAPGTPVRIAYNLTKDWTGPFRHPLQFHPILTPDYLEFTGSNALVRLKLADTEAEIANFDWTQLPPSWSLATSFGSTKSLSERCQTHTGPWQSINEGLYAAGDFRLVPFQILGQPAMLAIRGNWTFTDEHAVKQIKAIVGVVRNFWHDNRFPSFLVTLAPYDQEHGSSDGSQFTNAFWMFVSNKDSIDSLLPRLAHESFHAWNPGRMGFIPSGYDERYIGWFHEGATEYYAQLLTFKAGYLSPEDYVDSLNSDLRKFPDSSDEYVRGRIISLWLDGTIRQESNQRYSLDTVMFDMVNGKDQPYTSERLMVAIERYLSQRSRTSFEQAIWAHGNLQPPEHIPQFGCSAVAVSKLLPVFDLGFDYETSKANKSIVGVRKDGPAYSAGLRDGQKLLSSSITKGKPDQLATFKVSSESGEQRVSFYPQGPAQQVWEYEVGKTEACSISPALNHTHS